MDNMNTSYKPRKLLVAFTLAVAPVLCVLAAGVGAGGKYLPVEVLPYALAALLLAWSPLPVSIPAVVLGDSRDSFEPGGRGLGRGLRMVGNLSSASSPVRAEFLASLVGFAVAAVLVLI
jgi:hypothetical protein